MSNKKQTSIDWLVEKFNQCEPMYSGIQSNEHKEYLDKLVHQAKEMDKQQKIDAYNQGYRDGENDASNITLSIGDIEDYSNAEQYYKETYETSN